MDKWQSLAADLVKALSELVANETFRHVDGKAIQQLKNWLFHDDVLELFAGTMGYLHGDLSGDNVFVKGDDYVVIDWQRPLLGPRDLDLATLLASLDVDPLDYLEPALVQLAYLLRIHWFTACTLRWFPAGRETYDKSIADLINRLSSVGKSY